MAHIAIHKGVLHLHEMSIQSSIFLIQTIIYSLLSFITRFYLILFNSANNANSAFTTLRIVTQPLVKDRHLQH